MLHRLVASWLIVAAGLGPSLCCCSLKALGQCLESAVAAVPVSSDNRDHCCCNEREQRSDHDNPCNRDGQAPDKCPCQSDPSLASTLASNLPETATPKIPSEWFGGLELAASLGFSGIVEAESVGLDHSRCAAYHDGKAILRAHHVLRC